MTATLLDTYDVLLIDLDGTVYHGQEPVPGAVAAVDAAHRAGVAVKFVTNNASKAPEQVARHLRDLGVPAEPNEVATSAQAGARLLASLVSPGSSVLVVGTDSLMAEVEAVGLRPTRTNGDVAAVIQGHSPDTAWADLAEASLAIRAGAVWVACNVDPTLPTERGQLPGNGSMVAALRTATGAVPAIAGKPEPLLFTEAVRAAAARRPLIIGDRLDTDIAGAAAAGYDALLVLSGVTTPDDLIAAVPEHRPRYLGWDMSAVTEPAAELEVGADPAWRIETSDGVLAVRGDGDPLGFLRGVCAQAWATGITAVRPLDDGAVSAAKSLGVSVVDYG